MVGRKREGSGNANATSGGVHHPAPAHVVAANGGSRSCNGGKGSGGGGLLVEKVKFTVSVRGHQWSSTRHVNETLEEFASAIERNARRLAFIDSDDSIQRLQLACIDGSEPEDLDVDATLGDVIICMGDKQLLTIVNSNRATPPPATPSNVTPMRRPDSESTLKIISAKACNYNVSVAALNSSPDLLALSAAPKFRCFEAFALEFLTQLSLVHDRSIHCPNGEAISTALLESHLPAFPTPGAALPTPASCGDYKAPEVMIPVSNASPACNLEAEKENRPDPCVQANTAKRSVSGATSHDSKEKSPLSSDSSAKVHNSLAPQSGEGVDSELPNGGAELVFPVQRRRRKTGAGTQDVKLSDLPKYFHLSLVNAAKELGVAQSTLKNACRAFGLERWPGRKVRSMESNIHGLEYVIAMRQGDGLNDSTTAHMRSEILKLQQERDELIHGTPAQITQKMQSPVLRTVDTYKLVYAHGYRAESYHNARRSDTMTLHIGNPNEQASGLAPPTKPTTRKYVKKAAGENQQPVRRGRPRKAIALSQEDAVVTPRRGNHNRTQKTTSVKEQFEDEEEIIIIGERCLKRPKREQYFI